MKALTALLLALSLGTAAHAQKAQTIPSDLPAMVKDAMAKNLKECEAGEKPLYKPGFLTIRDINGDGKPDYILNYEHFQCGERVSVFCGTGGCQTEIFASEEDKGLVHVWDKLAQKVEFKTIGKRPAMTISLHGSLCGRNNSQRCAMTLYWNGSEFHPAN